jgi:hypothetical protein
MWRAAPVLRPDSAGYMHLAQNLGNFHLGDMSLRTPGYPILLVLTGASRQPTHTLFYVSLALHLISIWLLAHILSSLGLGHRALLIFAALLLLPPYVEASGYVLSENLAEFCLAAGFGSLSYWFFSKHTSLLWISAASFAYAALTRPTFQAAGLLLASYLWISPRLFPSIGLSSRQSLRAALILVLVPSAVMGVYSILNYVESGYFGSTALSLGLSTRTVRFVERLPDGYAKTREALIRARNADLIQTGSSHTGYQSTGRALGELQETAGIRAADIPRHLLKVNLLLITTAPLTYLQEGAYAISSYWFPQARPLANMNSRLVQLDWAIFHFLVVFCFALQLFVLGGTQFLQLSRRMFGSRGEPLRILVTTPQQIVTYYLALTLVVYTMLVSCFVQTGDPRYRIPTDPIIIFLVFLGGHIWINAVRRIPSGEPQQAACPVSGHDVATTIE